MDHFAVGFKARLAQVVMLPNIAFDLPLGMVQLERQESGWFQRTFQVRRWRNHLTRGRRQRYDVTTPELP